MPTKSQKSNKLLKIALLTYRGKPHCGGQGVYTRYLASELAELGHEVEVFSGQPYPVLNPNPKVKLTELPSLDVFNSDYPGRMPGFWEIKSMADFTEAMSSSLGTFGEPLAFSFRVLKELTPRKGEFDIVHDNQSLGYGLLELKRRGFPLIATMHHPITVDRHLEMEHAKNIFQKFSKSRWYAFTKMQSRVAQRIDQIMTITEATKKDIHSSQGVPLEKIEIVPVGVDPKLFKPIPEIKREPGHILTTASADVPLKGLSYLLEAIVKLRTERDVRLTVIGKLNKTGSAAKTIERLGLESAVTFISDITDQEVVETYASASVAVVPSLYEGFSLPAVEAMATGIPLVATNGGGLPEVVGTDGEAAILIKPGDPDALIKAIGQLLDSPELCKKLGENGIKRVSERWSWKRTAQLTAEQYYIYLDRLKKTQNANS